MDDLKKMLGKKDKNSNPDEKDAKLNALKALRNDMSSMMQDGLKSGLSKVTVASNDKEGLEEGLEKAKELVEKAPASEEMEESSEEEAEPEMDLASMDEEQLNELMKKISDRKKELMLNR